MHSPETTVNPSEQDKQALSFKPSLQVLQDSAHF